MTPEDRDEYIEYFDTHGPEPDFRHINGTSPSGHYALVAVVRDTMGLIVLQRGSFSDCVTRGQIEHQDKTHPFIALATAEQLEKLKARLRRNLQ